MAVNEGWSLESFVDSLVVELDKTRETLAVKAVNKKLTYTVKDMSLELQIFPTYDGDGDVRFTTAQPGQQGASKISLQLASITDNQVRATSKPLTGREDVKIDGVQLDPQAKRTLRRLGVTSLNDLEEIEKRDVDLEGVSRGSVDYKNLANKIRQARRGGMPPRVDRATLSLDDDGGGPPLLRIEGANLGVSAGHTPVAVLNDALGEVVAHGPGEVVVRLPPGADVRATNDLILTLDPYCIVRLEVTDDRNDGGRGPTPNPSTRVTP